ncbi:MAG: TPM domain-containing protein [Saprospiraceae bacterium]|nr:TPM domain-containing protein [Saprospiraceae bacterium]
MSKLFSPEKEEHIKKAISQIEAQTTGELRVYIEDKCPDNVHERVMKIFEQYGMHKTKNRNGVLIYVAVRSRQLYIWGDTGIHEVAGQDMWDQILKNLSADFADGMYESGIIRAIEAIGIKLKEHFPRVERENENELPDDIIYGF